MVEFFICSASWPKSHVRADWAYMADALAHLRSTGKVVEDAMMAHTSPVGWEHIAFSGDFLWEQAARRRSRKALLISDGARAA